jgi:hypothetical protein
MRSIIPHNDGQSRLVGDHVACRTLDATNETIRADGVRRHAGRTDAKAVTRWTGNDGQFVHETMVGAERFERSTS